MGAVERASQSLLGDRVASRRALHGGDLSRVEWVTLTSGRTVVAKTGPQVSVEARMLSVMAKAGAPVPQVLGQTGDILFLDALEEVQPQAASWPSLGRSLAKLHTVTGPDYGWAEDYAFASAKIANGQRSDWPDFWAANRLLPFVQDLPGGLGPRIKDLCARLPRLLPTTPPAALLHGDLWTGNVLFGPRGRAHFIDPACYYGHSEVDLAMLHLFGTPGPGFEAAYGALPPGWEERRAVYTLWPALVHLRLFGTSYRGMVDRLLSQLGH